MHGLEHPAAASQSQSQGPGQAQAQVGRPEQHHVVIEGLAKRFGAVTVLEGLDLAIDKGEFLTLLGPSGCGKTTLLRIIAGFLDADAGRIAVAGETLLGQPPHRRDFGMVFQNYAVFPHMTVFDNVAYGLRARNTPSADISQRVGRALERVRLGAFAQRFPTQLSGGQKQRVGLARAIVIEPRLLLMDEPLSNLDAKLRIDMRSEIRLLQRELGITTLYVTHDQEEALAVSDRIAVLEKGRMLQVGGPKAIYDEPAHRFVADFIGNANQIAARVEGGLVHFAGGVSMPLPGAASPAQAVTATLRPEDFRLSPSPDYTAALPVRVLLVSYLGARLRLSCELADGAALQADVDSDAIAPDAGETVSLWFNPGKVRLFSAEGWRV